MAMTNHLENGVLNHIFRGESFPALSASLHIGLFTAAPSDAGGGTEASGNGYARVAVTRNTTEWSAPSDNSGAQEIENENAITFPESTGSWGTVTHFGVFDAATSGNLLYWAALGTARNVNASGITVSFAASALTASQS